MGIFLMPDTKFHRVQLDHIIKELAA